MRWNSELPTTLPELSQTGVLENAGVGEDYMSIKRQGMLSLEPFARACVRLRTWWQVLCVVVITNFRDIGEECAKGSVQGI